MRFLSSKASGCIFPRKLLATPSVSPQVQKNLGNILHCLKYGCQLGWFIDPEDCSVLAFLPGQQPELMQGSDRLPILEEIPLELTVAQVFGWLFMGK
jgi:Uma2 family endonuclease